MLLALGLNHQSAPVAIREKVAFPAEQLPPALRELIEHHAVEEAAIVSTCNRTEIYCRTERPEAVQAWLTHYHALEQHHVAPYLYRLEQDQAAAHAFRVASGLDSMVVGEAQILGQMKQAMRAAAAAGTLGWLLHKLFQHTFSVAKQVRTQTEIGANSVSMAAAAVRLATRVFGEVKDLQVLFVGAGEMIELCATHLHAQYPRRMSVTNRTLERAQALAHRFNADAFTLSELPEQIANYDVIVTSTASSLPIIGKGLMERVIKARRHKPVVMVDLAVPRDVEAEVGELADIYLYTVDDLGAIVSEGRHARQSAVAEAETIISAQVSEFRRWLDSRAAVPMVRQLREFAEQYRRAELERARRMLARGDDPQQVLDALSQGLTNKFLHHPTRALTQAEHDDYPALSQLVNRLFPPNESE